MLATKTFAGGLGCDSEKSRALPGGEDLELRLNRFQLSVLADAAEVEGAGGGPDMDGST
jgi:hypothetical protein